MEIEFAVELLAQRAVEEVPGLRVEADGATFGPEDGPSTLRGDRYDLYRAMMGRRSSAQLRALDWSGRAAARRSRRSSSSAPLAADVVE